MDRNWEENKVMMRRARGLYVFELMQKTEGRGAEHRTRRKKRTRGSSWGGCGW